MKSKDEIKTAVEAILFTMGDAVALTELAAALEEPEIIVKGAVEEMMEERQNPASGIEIIELDGCYQMCTKRSAYEYLIKLVQIPKNFRLTDVQLETLSIIAYKQPITKADIEKIRGVSADHAVNKLMEAGLIEEGGRLTTPGRPMLFVTTQEFLRRFGLGCTDDLPDINTEKMETFKMEAEDELGYHPEPEESVIVGDNLTGDEAGILSDAVAAGEDTSEAGAQMLEVSENSSDNEPETNEGQDE